MTKIIIKVNSRAITVPPPLPEGIKFIRVLHEAELPPSKRFTPKRQPQVRPLFPNHFSVFAYLWQMLSWLLNEFLNASNMTSVYNTHLWISNNHGFGDASVPRKNFFKNEDLDANDDLMVESLTCGGNLLHTIGEMMFKTTSGVVPCYIIETLNVGSIPDMQWLEDHPWLITVATKLDGDGEPTKFPQGQQPNGFVPGVVHPLVCNRNKYPIIVIEKWRCKEWNHPYPPEPYTVYDRYQSLLQRALVALFH